jgi:hypothetical protein
VASRTTDGVLVPARSATDATVPKAMASGSTSSSSATWRSAGDSAVVARRAEIEAGARGAARGAVDGAVGLM